MTYAVIGLFAFAILLFLLLIILRLLVSRREKSVEGEKDRLQPFVYAVVAGDGEATAELKLVAGRRNRADLEEVLLDTARAVKGREREALAGLFEELGYVDDEIRKLQKRGIIGKARAAFHLGSMRSARATSLLVKELSPRSPEVEFACLNALSKIGTPEAIDAVAGYLLAAPGVKTMRVAEVILEKKQDFSPYLERWLERGDITGERLVLLIELVGAMKDPRAVSLLIPYLSHPDPRVRSETASALGGIGDHAACDTLEAVMDDAEHPVRASAAVALGRLQCDSAIPRLKVGLSDPSLEVKMNSAVALSRLGAEGRAALEAGLKAAAAQEREVAAEVLDRERIHRGGNTGES